MLHSQRPKRSSGWRRSGNTLTIHRVGITATLRRILVTTNPIECAIEIVKTKSARVKRWNGSAMVMRWVGTGLVQAEQHVRRVKGHGAIPTLVAALERHTSQVVA
jgi:hypothetical protein